MVAFLLIVATSGVGAIPAHITADEVEGFAVLAIAAVLLVRFPTRATALAALAIATHLWSHSRRSATRGSAASPLLPSIRTAMR